MANPKLFLTQTAASLRRLTLKLDRLDGNLTEHDISARRIEADIGWQFAKAVDQIEAALSATGSNQRLDQWVKEHCGCDIGTMRRRKRLHKQWKEYESQRRKLGQCGQSGLLFALSLVSDEPNAYRNKQSRTTVRSVAKTISRSATKSATVRNDRVEFVTGDSLTELPKFKEKSVNVVLTSPPYWPLQRAYGGKGLGYEKTLPEYLGNLVAILSQVKRVLRDEGILWVIIGDTYRDGDLQFIPTRLAMALQSDDWICRSEIVWLKTNVRPESVNNRPSRNYEKV